jgi:hypothetical protein
MRRAAFAALALALAAGATARAQSPSLPAPSASGPAAPASGSMLDPTPAAQRLAPLSPVKPPETPSSLLRKRPFPSPSPPVPSAAASPAAQAAPAPAPLAPSAPLAVAPPPPGFDPRICAGGGLSAAQAQACRDEFQRKIEADRARVEARREAERIAREERAARRGPQLKPRQAPLDFFLVEDLAYGDVVMTDKGARVFIGKRDAMPGREDFVTLDDPRSPRRDPPARLKRAPRGL